MVGLIQSFLNMSHNKASAIHRNCFHINKDGRNNILRCDIAKCIGGFLYFQIGQRIDVSGFIYRTNNQRATTCITESHQFATDVIVVKEPFFELHLTDLAKFYLLDNIYFLHCSNVFG